MTKTAQNMLPITLTQNFQPDFFDLMTLDHRDATIVGIPKGGRSVPLLSETLLDILLGARNILDGAGVDIPWQYLKHVQQPVQFSSIIGLWDFQKLKINYLQNVQMKLCKKNSRQRRHVTIYH